jgi:hypothetical protein
VLDGAAQACYPHLDGGVLTFRRDAERAGAKARQLEVLVGLFRSQREVRRCKDNGNYGNSVSWRYRV